MNRRIPRCAFLSLWGWCGLATVVALALVGWSGTGGEEATPRLPDRTPVPVLEETVPAKVAMEYQRQGGFAGFDDRLVVYADGRATLTRRGAPAADVQLALDELADLQAVSAATGFCEEPAEALPPSPGVDRFSYVVTDHSCAPPHTVRTAEGAIPRELLPLLSAIDRLVGRFPPR